MKNSWLYTAFLSAMVFSSCDFDGVKSSTDDNDVITFDNDTSGNHTANNLINDTIVPGNPYDLLRDTIQGEANEMVYAREDGLRVEWTVKNDSDPIKANDVVLVNYEARVAAGEQYDSNKEMGTPAPLKTNIGMMVEGWEDGLLQMNVGDVGRILIPSALGYGENGYSTIVPPDADLIIEIEIVSRVEPVVLEEGVKVYIWKKSKVGELPVKDDVITFDYFAYTVGENGRLYDNSFQNREPFSFKLENDNVIDGLHQGMAVLREEENAFIEIPADLAYGRDGLLDLVPKNTPIVYDVRVQRID